MWGAYVIVDRSNAVKKRPAVVRASNEVPSVAVQGGRF